MQENTTDHIAKMAWDYSKNQWQAFMALPVVVMVGSVLIQALLVGFMGNGLAIFLTFLIMIAQVVFMVSFQAALLKWCDELYNGKKSIDIEAGLHYGLSRFWGSLGTGIITSIKVFLWSLLLILPGVYKGIQYSQSIKVSQLEKISGGDANRVSQKMVMGSGMLRTLGNVSAMSTVVQLGLYLLMAVVVLLAAITSLVSDGLAIIVAAALGSAGFIFAMTVFIVFFNFQYLAYRKENKTSIDNMVKALQKMKSA